MKTKPVQLEQRKTLPARKPLCYEIDLSEGGRFKLDSAVIGLLNYVLSVEQPHA